MAQLAAAQGCLRKVSFDKVVVRPAGMVCHSRPEYLEYLDAIESWIARDNAHAAADQTRECLAPMSWWRMKTASFTSTRLRPDAR